MALGADYKALDFLKLRLGFALEDGVASNEWRTPRTPDSDRTILAGGLGFKFLSYKLDLSYANYSFKAAKINLKEDITSDPRINEGRGSLSGDVKTSAGVFMLGLSFTV